MWTSLGPNAGLILISLSIGAMVGAAGVGGFLMPMALTLITSLSLHEGTATSLFTFIFIGLAGTIYFQHKGSINWSLVWPICAGAAVTGFAGAWVGSLLSPIILSLVLATLIIIAGAYTFFSSAYNVIFKLPQGGKKEWVTLATIGAVTGFLSGMTGIGGPALSVPLMVLFGFSILTAIGVGQVLQIVGALSGTIANLQMGTIDFGLASFICVFEIVGVLLGAYLLHRMDSALIKKMVGTLCLVAGFALIFRTL